MFTALDIHAHGGQHALLAKVHAVDVDDQQLNFVEAPFQQLLQRRCGGFGGFPAHGRSRPPSIRGKTGRLNPMN
ncbi:MAG: hypothetical protein DMG57_25725 [Acidobacteria bacterium]|nr:MAG: hypothetical protein DMG57_25725 [Acidobacteriota bacterium]